MIADIMGKVNHNNNVFQAEGRNPYDVCLYPRFIYPPKGSIPLWAETHLSTSILQQIN